MSTIARAAVPLHCVVMGVSGCGKSEIGRRLAANLGLPLIEGDQYHPATNIAKMSRGQPLDDADRAPWLQRLAGLLLEHPGGAVLACSALKRAYRDVFRTAVPGVRFIYLRLTPEQARRRVAARTDHFYPSSLVDSQFAALQEPLAEPGVVAVDATQSPRRMVAAVRVALGPPMPANGQADRISRSSPATGNRMTSNPTKAFASKGDLSDKKITFERLSEHCWAYTAEGDPNSGVIIGDRFVMVSDATATPAMAQDLIAKIRTVSDKPIKYVLLTHYHAVRVLGAYAYAAEGATEIIASQGTLELIRERGAEDMKSEMERFPRLFRNAESVPGLTWPTLVVDGGSPVKGEVPGKLKINLGGVVVQVWHPGPGHTRGDTIAWVEEEKVLFSGDLVEYEAGVYTGDAQLEEWPATLEALRALKAEALVPGRGEAMKGAANVDKALNYTKRWVETLYRCGREAVAQGMDLKAAMAHTRRSMDPVFGHVFIYEHCLPFDVSRAYDEASGIKNPRIWTAERDQAMWAALQA